MGRLIWSKRKGMHTLDRHSFHPSEPPSLTFVCVCVLYILSLFRTIVPTLTNARCSLLKREIEGTYGVAATGSRRAPTTTKKKPNDETIQTVCGSHNLLRKVKHRFDTACVLRPPPPTLFRTHTRACDAFQFDSCAPAVILPSRPTLPTLRSN